MSHEKIDSTVTSLEGSKGLAFFGWFCDTNKEHNGLPIIPSKACLFKLKSLFCMQPFSREKIIEPGILSAFRESIF